MRITDPRLLGRARAVRLALAADAALGVVAALLVLAQAVLLARVAARAFGGASLEDVSVPLGLLVAVAAGRAAAAWGFEVVGRRAATDVLSRLRLDVVERRLRDRPAALDGAESAEVATAAVAGVDALETTFARYLPQVVLAAVVPLAVIILVASIDLLSAGLMLLTLPLVPIFMWLVGRYTEGQTRKRWQALALLSTHFLDVVRGLPTLRAFNRGEAQAERIAEVSDRYRVTTMATLRVAFLSGAVLELAATLGIALVAVTVGVRLVNGGIGFESALTVLVLAPELYLPLRNLAAQFHASSDGLAVAERLLDLAEAPAGVGSAADVPPSPRDEPVRLEGVSFSYPAREGEVLDSVDLELAPGETVALVGPSGGGKSTIASLLLRLAEPTAGRVVVGAVDLAECDPAAWRSQIAWVPQHPTLFRGSVTDNIRLGDAAAADERVRAAAELAGADCLRRRAAERLRDRRRRRRTAALGRAAPADRARASVPAQRAARHSRRADRRPRSRQRRGDRSRGRAAGRGQNSPPDRPPSRARGPGRPDRSPRGRARRGAGGGGRMTGTLRRLLGLAGMPWRRVALSVLLGALAVGFGVALMTTAGYLISRAAEQPPILSLTETIVVVRFLALSRPIVRYLDRLVSHDLALRGLGRIRARFYERIEPLAPAQLEGYRRGDLLTRMVGDVDALQGLYLRGLAPPLVALAVGAACVGVAAAVLPAAAAILAAGLVVGGVAVPALAGSLGRAAGRRQAPARAALTAELVELLRGAPELVAYGREEATLARVRTADGELARLGRRDALVAGLADALSILVAGVTAAGVLAVAVSAHDTGQLDRVLIATLALLALSSFDAVSALPAAARELSATLAAGRRVLDLVDREASVRDPAEPLAPPSLPATVTLEGVTARYGPDEEPALSGFELRLDPGKRIALVGPSGAGKTTVTNLLLRFLDPEQGRVAIAGRDIREYRQEDVRNTFALAGQDAHLFASTIRANLLLARPDAAEAELEGALGRARIADWVASLPDGLETLVGEEGTQLSGGQRQRLVLARALLADTPVLLLDEPTAHLDPETAEELVRDVLSAAEGRTVLLITHRPEGLDLVDEVVSIPVTDR